MRPGAAMDAVVSDALQRARVFGGGRWAIPASEDLAMRVAGLTSHQLRAALLSAHGMPNKVIADMLGCSPSTIGDHLRATHTCMGFAKNLQVAVALARVGLLR